MAQDLTLTGLTDDQIARVQAAIAGNGQLPPPPPGRTGKVIVVVSPKGGSGKTAVATNLAASLAQQFPGKVAAVDLDVQFGDMCTSMGLHPEHNLAQVATTPNIDATTIKLFLTPYEPGLYVLCGARAPAEADVVTHEHVTKVIPLLAADFDYVVVDTSAGLDDRTLAALEQASDILLVSSLDVTSIRSLRKAVEAMDAIGVTKSRHFVLNRADAKVGLRVTDASEAVGLPIVAMIPSCREVPLSMNVGTPVIKLAPRSEVAKRMKQLAQLFVPASHTNGSGRRRWFR